jgi:hypothetical protein
MRKIFTFDRFVNENYVNEDGYGDLPFFYAKNGDVANYFFKVGAETQRGFVISIGKFSKFAQPSEGKAEYSVLSITELPVDAIDQAVIDKGNFETNDNHIEVDERELNKVLEMLCKCVEDYLQKNPKVTKFYDEMQANLRNTQYTSKMTAHLDKWPGGQGAWKMQEVEAGKLNYIVK